MILASIRVKVALIDSHIVQTKSRLQRTVMAAERCVMHGEDF